MVTVARFFDMQSAELARIALEGSGVPVFVEPEGYGTATIGGIRVQVPPSFAEDARAILKDLATRFGGELY